MTTRTTTVLLALVAGLLAVPSAVPTAGAAAADDGTPARTATVLSLTAQPVRRSVPYDQPAEIRGFLTDDDPTTGPLAGVEISLYVDDYMRNEYGDDIPGYYQTRYSTTTDANGAYRLRWNLNEYRHTFRVAAFQGYGPAEDRDDAPVADPGHVNGRALIGNVTTTVRSGARFTVKGGIAPRATPGDTIELYAGRQGARLTYRGRYFLRSGVGVFGRTYELARGRWNIRVRYVYRDGILDSPVYAKSIVLR